MSLSVWRRQAKAAAQALALLCIVSPAVFADTQPPLPALPTGLEDIRISEQDDRFSLLVLLTQQPSGASVLATEDAAALDIDGVSLAPFGVTPEPGFGVHSIAGEPNGEGGIQIVLTGAALEDVQAVVYRNSVLLTGRRVAFAEPARTQTQTESLIAADLATLSPERCTEAATQLAADMWDLAALGDQALCLLRAGDSNAAKPHLDQLAAFAPEDPRVALGRAQVLFDEGDAASAKTLLEHTLLVSAGTKARALITDALATLPAAETK